MTALEPAWARAIRANIVERNARERYAFESMISSYTGIDFSFVPKRIPFITSASLSPHLIFTYPPHILLSFNLSLSFP